MKHRNHKWLLGLLGSVSAFASVAPLFGMRFEAEDMELIHYEVVQFEKGEGIQLNHQHGTATFQFPFPPGRYDFDARYVSEKVGQNTYTVYVNETQVVSWLGKNRDDQWHMMNEQQWHIPRNLLIEKGDEIRIEGLSGTGSLAILDYIEFSTSGKSNALTRNNMVTVFPEEYEAALKNPLKGFRPGLEKEHEFGTLIKSYIPWNALEADEQDGVEKIRAFSDAAWAGYEKRNIKFIPRVYLNFPRRESAWPADLEDGDFTSDAFQSRLIRFIRKLGEAWNEDPRVAYVEMGIIGQWGEMEWPDTSDAIKAAMAAEFAAAFTNKLVMIRWPNTYHDDIYNFGYYWDSFAHHDQAYCGFYIENTSPKWKTTVIGGETAYDWGNRNIQPGASPDVSLTQPVHLEYILNSIRRLHANHVGWIANYDQGNAQVRAGAELVQKALGYRFVMTEFCYTKEVGENDALTVAFKVRNDGSSPFYYNWPVEISLLEPATREPVLRRICSDVDIRKWLPGDQWDRSRSAYAIAAEDYLVNQFIDVSGVKPGEYVIAVAILDPAGNQPSVRFAVKNYFKGGRHPMGKVGIQSPVLTSEVTGFDDPKADDTLGYEVVRKVR